MISIKCLYGTGETQYTAKIHLDIVNQDTRSKYFTNKTV